MAEDDNVARDPAALVLGSGELLDAILLHTDPKTLLLSQRVSKRWHARINQNAKLQKKLFFAPTTFAEAMALQIDNEQVQPIIIGRGETWGSLLPPDFLKILSNPKASVEELQHALSNVSMINPLLPWKIETSHRLSLNLSAFPFDTVAADPNRPRITPSWMRMYLSAPMKEPFSIQVEIFNPAESVHLKGSVKHGEIYGFNRCVDDVPEYPASRLGDAVMLVAKQTPKDKSWTLSPNSPRMIVEMFIAPRKHCQRGIERLLAAGLKYNSVFVPSSETPTGPIEWYDYFPEEEPYGNCLETAYKDLPKPPYPEPPYHCDMRSVE